MASPYRFQASTRIVGGRNLLQGSTLREELTRTGARRLLLVTDRGVVQAGLEEQVRQAAGDMVIDSFDGCVPNAEASTVAVLADRIRRAGADGLLALGGGSVMDTAKAAAMLITLGGDSILEHLTTRLTQPLNLRLICIPTTAGTGSEVSIGAVIKDTARGLKIPLGSQYLVPDLAILIPELTAGLPAPLTAATGFDALTHAIEAYLSPRANPLTDALALDAMKRIIRWLPEAMDHPGELTAREQMLAAASMAALAFNSAMLGACHAVAHALGGQHEVPHGVANALLLPTVMAFNEEACKPRWPALSLALGGADPVTLVTALRSRLGLPDRLSKVGVTPSPALVQAAMADPFMKLNPRPVTEADVQTWLEHLR
ncbi:MAG: iron-containing alcohol dehydrogenase family protein [Bacillota bacterium]